MGERSNARRVLALAFSILISVVLSFFISPDASAASATNTAATAAASNLRGTITYVTGIQQGVSGITQYFYGNSPEFDLEGSPCGRSSSDKDWCSTHEFLGWSLTEGSGVVDYEGGQDFDASLLGKTLYGVWKNTATYVVQYQGNGDDDNSVHWAIYDGTIGYDIVIDSGADLKRDGYIFAGWNTQPNGSGESVEPGQKITLTRGYLLFAQWTEAPVTEPTDPDVTDPTDPDVTEPTDPGATEPDVTEPSDPDKGSDSGATTDPSTKPSSGTDGDNSDSAENGTVMPPVEPTGPTNTGNSGTSAGSGSIPSGVFPNSSQQVQAEAGKASSPVETILNRGPAPQNTADASNTHRTIVMPESVISADGDTSENNPSTVLGPHDFERLTTNESNSDDRGSQKEDQYSKMQVQGDEASTQSESTNSKYGRDAGVLVGVASVLFVGVAAAFFPLGSVSAAAGISKISMASKMLQFLHR